MLDFNFCSFLRTIELIFNKFCDLCFFAYYCTADKFPKQDTNQCRNHHREHGESA